MSLWVKWASWIQKKLLRSFLDFKPWSQDWSKGSVSKDPGLPQIVVKDLRPAGPGVYWWRERPDEDKSIRRRSSSFSSSLQQSRSCKVLQFAVWPDRSQGYEWFSLCTVGCNEYRCAGDHIAFCVASEHPVGPTGRRDIRLGGPYQRWGRDDVRLLSCSQKNNFWRPEEGNPFW